MRSQNPTDRIRAKKPTKRKPLTKRVLNMPMFTPRIQSCATIGPEAVDQLSYGLALAYRKTAKGM